MMTIKTFLGYVRTFRISKKNKVNMRVAATVMEVAIIIIKKDLLSDCCICLFRKSKEFKMKVDGK